MFGDQADPFAESTASYEKMIRQEVDAKGAVRRADYEAGVENTRKLAFLFEDLFQGGTDAVWRDFKDQGFRAIAELLAKAAITSFSKGGGGFGGLLSSLAGAVTGALGIGGGNQALGASISAGSSHALDFLSKTPGFATGGSMRIGGVPGVDRNLLSLNGQPMARVSAGEVLNIGTAAANVRANPAAAGPTIVQQHMYVDARGSVMNDKFAAQILAQAKAWDAQASAETAKATLRASAGYLGQSRRYGGSKTI